jgi:PAS domain S-box-containing protein
MVENSPDIVDRYSRELVHTYMNRAGLALINLPADRVIGKTIRETGLAEPWCSLWEARIRRAFDEGQPFEVEDSFPSPDGPRYYQSSVVPEPAADGAVASVLVVSRETTDRRLTEEAIRESEAKYKTLVDTTGTGYVIIDGEGRVLDANAEYVRLSGHSRLEDILGRSVVEWTAPYDRARNADEVRKCLERGFVRGLVVDYVWPDRTYVPIEVNATVRKTQTGMTILTLCRDITERRRADRALRASERQYRLTVNSMTDPIHVVDCDLQIVLVNDALKHWCRRFGVPETQVGQHLLQAFPFLRERVQEEYRNVFRTGELLDTRETTLVAGQPVVTETRKVPVVEDGIVARVLTVMRDITERQKSEDALRRSERMVTAILNASTEPILLIDSGHRVLAANVAILRRLGVTATEFIGRHVTDFFPPHLATSRERHLQNVLDTGMPERFEDERDGRVLDNHVYPVLDEGGRTVALAVFSNDITDRKRAEEAMRRTQDELERRVAERTAQLRALAAELTRVESEERRRLAEILHEDLQQMLTGARYRLDAIGTSATAEEHRRAARDVSEILVRATDIASSLTTDLRPPVLYEEGVEAALSWLATDMKHRFGLEVEVDVEPGAEPASDDLRIFLFNTVRELLFNVTKHSGVHSALVRLRPLGDDMIEVEVADEGAGFTADGNSARGFGLFGIRERAGFFGGEMKIESAPGKGTRVTLVLPRR